MLLHARQNISVSNQLSGLKYSSHLSPVATSRLSMRCVFLVIMSVDSIKVSTRKMWKTRMCKRGFTDWKKHFIT